MYKASEIAYHAALQLHTFQTMHLSDTKQLLKPCRKAVVDAMSHDVGLRARVLAVSQMSDVM